MSSVFLIVIPLLCSMILVLFFNRPLVLDNFRVATKRHKSLHICHLVKQIDCFPMVNMYRVASLHSPTLGKVADFHALAITMTAAEMRRICRDLC